jgi:hypothetical protein
MRRLPLGMGTGSDCAQLESEDEVLTGVEQLAAPVLPRRAIKHGG